MKKRLFAMLLAVCLVLSMSPAAFAAEGDVAKIGDTGPRPLPPYL